MIRHISIILLLAFSFGLNAQKPVTFSSRLKSQRQDTLKKPRILKQWNLSADFSGEVTIPFDTVFSLFNRFKIADRYSPVNATLGNYGLPFYQISFFDRITDPDKFLYCYYYPFMHVADKALFMNTQAPFTELIWTFAGPRETSEQTFRVTHSQNVNRFFNFGLIYDIIFSLGQYNYQRAEDKAFTIYSSYIGARYKLYFAAGINNLTSYENGGITDKNELSKFTASKIRDVPVKLGGLDKANSMLKNRNLLLVQRYTLKNNPAKKSDSVSNKRSGFFGLSGTFSHIFMLESNKRTYSDGYPESGLYDTAFISKTVTFDSLYSRSLKNTVRFDFTTDETRKFRLGGGVGLRNEVFRYSQIIPTHDTTVADTVVWNRTNNAVVGRFYNGIGDKFSWVATGELFLAGYRAGDFNLNGVITKSFDWKKGRASWLLTGGITKRQPSFWYELWGSNHFEWYNIFKKEFRIDLGSVFLYPARKAELKFNYAVIKNYTDFDTAALPSQYSENLSVAALTVSKELRAWKFHLASDVIIQKSSNVDVLDLPLVTVRSALFFEHHFRFKKTGGKLSTQLGGDITYNTPYHPYSYMPATGRFFRQDQVSAGDYPFINVFINFKVKRTRVFFMFDHVNSGMMGYNYDMIPLYPMSIRKFRFGVAWTFYN
ncbi:MAG: hypothetical protein NTV31_12385 [Bacteroidia bacterium]|nr:hypothetical protein [Bacteroidia bacterium]